MAENVVVSTAVLTNSLDFFQAEDYYLKLFTDDDLTPSAAMVPGDFTEAAGGDYAHVVVDSSEDWSEEYGNTPPDLILAEQTFTFTGVLTGPQAIYGWYLITQDSASVRAAKLLDSPYTPASGGGTLKFTPRIQAGNGTPA